MTRINPDKLRLSKSSFEYDADSSFDTIEGGRYKSLKALVLQKIKERGYKPDDVESLKGKLVTGQIFHQICSSCDKDVFTSKTFLECKECGQGMTSFPMGKNDFVCSNCSKSWIGYVYDDLCPNCR